MAQSLQDRVFNAINKLPAGVAVTAQELKRRGRFGGPHYSIRDALDALTAAGRVVRFHADGEGAQRKTVFQAVGSYQVN